MNRLLIVSIIGIITGYIGISIKRMYKSRYVLISDYNDFIGELIEEVSFGMTPIVQLIDRVIDSYHREFRHILEDYKASIRTNRDISIKNICLKENEKKIIQNCLNEIGRVDQSTEIINLKNEQIEAKNLQDKAKRDVKEKGDLIAKLAIMLGIALIILLI